MGFTYQPHLFFQSLPGGLTLTKQAFGVYKMNGHYEEIKKTPGGGCFGVFTPFPLSFFECFKRANQRPFFGACNTGGFVNKEKPIVDLFLLFAFLL